MTIGFRTFWGSQKTNFTTAIAHHVLIFLVAPLAGSYSQSVCVYLTCGPTKGNILAVLIIEIIRKRRCICRRNYMRWSQYQPESVDRIRSIWCKNHTNNKILHPLDHKQHSHFFSNAPHLFKCIRNRLIDQDIHVSYLVKA